MGSFFNIGKKIIDGGLPGFPRIDFELARQEFIDELRLAEQVDEILALIEYDGWRYLIPYSLLKPIWERLGQLEARSSFVLRWYGSMLRFYAKDQDQKLANSLFAEAERLDNPAGASL